MNRLRYHALWATLLLCSLLELLGCTLPLEAGNGVSLHGQLHVEGTGLVDERGQATMLRGMSSHGIAWYPQYLNGGAMKTLREYGANLFRIAVYTEPKGAYLEDPKRSLDYLYMGMESALSQDLYVIVDWHILEDGNPNQYAKEAESFFREVSAHYADEPGVLYEICNEPNGETTWDDIVEYAGQIIPVIRANSPNAVIIIGTPDYCTNFTGPLEQPLEFDNILYSLHRYIDISVPGTGDAGQLPALLDQGIPIFVSEWGVSWGEQAYLEEEAEDSSDIVNPERAQPFIDYMEGHNVSWAGWALSNKDEWHSALRTDCGKLSGWTEEDLTVSGRLMFGNFKGHGREGLADG